MLEAIFVNLEERKIVGLLPKKTFLGPILAMAERNDLEVLDATTGNFRRDGGDGGGSNSPSKRPSSQMYYKLVRRFESRSRELTPA